MNLGIYSNGIVYTTFVVLVIICGGLQFFVLRRQQQPNVGNNPVFLKFQYTYFAAYFTALFADWLQGPYLYQLYSHYGFMEDQIAVIYSCGFASTVILGTWAPVAADRFGRRKLCIVFTIIYSISCVTKLFNDYGVLIVGRILGGISTSLLFYTFEAWYIHEHIERNDFPKEWILTTFTKATVWNGALSIVAGVVANIVSYWLDFGPVAPFMLAIPFLLVSGIVVMSHWQENYGGQTINFRRSCMDGLKEVLTEERIFFIGAIQSMFESVMYIFIFIWTPSLMPKSYKWSLGIVFSCFMVCIVIGAAIFQIIRMRKVSVVATLGFAIFCSMLAMLTNIFTMGRQPLTSFFAGLLMEIGVGIYFPSMGFIRMKVIPDEYRTSITSWFRVPLNLIACVVLTLLHGTPFNYGNKMIFVACTLLLTVAMMCLLRFSRLIRRDSEFVGVMEESETVEIE